MSTASEVCLIMLCICSTGPQHSVTITSCSPTESTEASKNLLYRWISETVVIITLHLFAFFRRTQFIAFFARVRFLSLGQLTVLEARRHLSSRAPPWPSSLQNTQDLQVQWQVLFKRSPWHSPASQPSSSANQCAIAPKLGWDLRGQNGP